MTLQEELSEVRSEVEVYFFAASKYVERSVAEKIAADLYKISINTVIDLHKTYIKLSENLTKTTKIKGKYYDGLLWSQECRIKTHQKEIKKLTRKLELIEFL